MNFFEFDIILHLTGPEPPPRSWTPKSLLNHLRRAWPPRLPSPDKTPPLFKTTRPGRRRSPRKRNPLLRSFRPRRLACLHLRPHGWLQSQQPAPKILDRYILFNYVLGEIEYFLLFFLSRSRRRTPATLLQSSIRLPPMSIWRSTSQPRTRTTTRPFIRARRRRPRRESQTETRVQLSQSGMGK